MAVITVSREYGSRGEQVAQRVAKALGYSCFDKEILGAVAHAANTTEESIRRYDEKDEHGLRHFLKKLIFPESLPLYSLEFHPHYPTGSPMDSSPLAFDEERAVERAPIPDAAEAALFFCQVIEKLRRRGNVVIIGRGSQRILAAKPNTLHVRFIAPVGDRIEWVMEDEGVVYRKTLKQIRTIDRQRAHYLKHCHNVDWAEAKLYHLVINTGLVGIRLCKSSSQPFTTWRLKPKDEMTLIILKKCAMGDDSDD